MRSNKEYRGKGMGLVFAEYREYDWQDSGPQELVSVIDLTGKSLLSIFAEAHMICSIMGATDYHSVVVKVPSKDRADEHMGYVEFFDLLDETYPNTGYVKALPLLKNWPDGSFVIPSPYPINDDNPD